MQDFKKRVARFINEMLGREEFPVYVDASNSYPKSTWSRDFFVGYYEPYPEEARKNFEREMNQLRLYAHGYGDQTNIMYFRDFQTRERLFNCCHMVRVPIFPGILKLDNTNTKTNKESQ